jgi:hypothetical protein
MGKTSPTFKQRDLTRAYRAVEAADGQVARIEIQGSKVTLIPGNPERAGESDQASGDPDDKIAL